LLVAVLKAINIFFVILQVMAKQDIFFTKRRWNYTLIIIATIIGVASVLYSSHLTNMLADSERRNVELWAECTKLKIEVDDERFLDFLTDVQNKYTQIPAILTDADHNVLSYKEIDSADLKINISKSGFWGMKIKEMASQHSPIVIRSSLGNVFYVYYKDSSLLTAIKYFPHRQLTTIAIFLILAYVAFSSSRKSEQNYIWVGMSKETAHQLGTPISSIMAWIEILKDKYTESDDQELFNEMEHDVSRLMLIADRFSKIGSVPVLELYDIKEETEKIVDYISKRISSKIKISIISKEEEYAYLCPPLYEWVVENLCKNAANAIGKNEGEIIIEISKSSNKVFIDIKDTGVGIARSKFESVFEPGYTTRQRGWGLGLSLVRRIIQNYHNGYVYVKDSELGRGTTFRIVLNG
jgi:two-component system, sporulation sensor kinase D